MAAINPANVGVLDLKRPARNFREFGVDILFIAMCVWLSAVSVLETKVGSVKGRGVVWTL